MPSQPAGHLHPVEAHPAHIQAPFTQLPSSPSAMAAYYDSLDQSSEALRTTQHSDIPAPNEILGTISPQPDVAKISSADGLQPNVCSTAGVAGAQVNRAVGAQSDANDQRSATPGQSSPYGPTTPHDDSSAAPGQGTRTAEPEPQQEPHKDQPKPLQRNNIVPLPFKVRDKHV